jgi:hydroxymethylbilane synthase
MRKFLEGDFSGLIMAKAGIDRLLSFPDTIQSLDPALQAIIPNEDKKEFQEISHLIRSYLDQMMVMVLPLSLNPNAPAQGALAVEVLKKDNELNELFAQLTDPETNSNTLLERKILGQFGGGCHQKIGVAILSRNWGRIQFMRGLTDAEIHLNAKSVLDESNEINAKQTKYSRDQVWPPNANMLNRKRKDLSTKLPQNEDLFIARKSAVSEEHVSILKKFQPMEKILWTAGTGTWRDLADRDLWVHGTTDSLGETEGIDIETLIGRKTNFIKLTHNLSRGESSPFPVLTTYEVLGFEDIPHIEPNSILAAFWRSGSEFDTITERYPELLNVEHYCGVGSTYEYLKSKGLQPIPYYNFKDWADSLAQGEA